MINASRDNNRSVEAPIASERYTLTAEKLEDAHVLLNGAELRLGADDSSPQLKGVTERAGRIPFAPESLTFLAFPDAHNASCR